MARSLETGIGYFPLDTGIFSDRKIRKLLKTFESKGYLIYTFVLCEIYKDKGYFVKCDTDFLFDIADTLNLSEGLVKEVIQFCLSNVLFDKRVFDVEGVLTSSGVQKRYLKIKERSAIKIDEKYIIAEEKSINVAITDINVTEITENDAIIPQSKVKKSKVNKSKKKEKEFIPPSLEEVKSYFKENGYKDNVAERAFRGYNEANWHDSNGNKIKNWKQKMNFVWFKDDNKDLNKNNNNASKPDGLGEIINFNEK